MAMSGLFQVFGGSLHVFVVCLVCGCAVAAIVGQTESVGFFFDLPGQIPGCFVLPSGQQRQQQQHLGVFQSCSTAWWRLQDCQFIDRVWMQSMSGLPAFKCMCVDQATGRIRGSLRGICFSSSSAWPLLFPVWVFECHIFLLDTAQYVQHKQPCFVLPFGLTNGRNGPGDVTQNRRSCTCTRKKKRKKARTLWTMTASMTHTSKSPHVSPCQARIWPRVPCGADWWWRSARRVQVCVFCFRVCVYGYVQHCVLWRRC